MLYWEGCFDLNPMPRGELTRTHQFRMSEDDIVKLRKFLRKIGYGYSSNRVALANFLRDVSRSTAVTAAESIQLSLTRQSRKP